MGDSLSYLDNLLFGRLKKKRCIVGFENVENTDLLFTFGTVSCFSELETIAFKQIIPQKKLHYGICQNRE